MKEDFVILIPSRIGSTRLKNKPLVDLNGKSLIQRVFERGMLITDNVYIATDSNIVKDHVSSFTSNVVMTSNEHISGTDRVCEAASILSLSDDQLIVNLQGDEPFMPDALILSLVNDYYNNSCDVITARHPIEDSDIENPNCVKAIIDDNSFALDFIRNIDDQDSHDLFRHIGIYGYAFSTLKKLVMLDPSNRELNLKLEQLRFIDNNYSIFVSLYKESIQ
jgi:3-deoxy-manno-octulosonate cytidylyltransferase (CMP-KDO synthetase)